MAAPILCRLSSTTDLCALSLWANELSQLRFTNISGVPSILALTVAADRMVRLQSLQANVSGLYTATIALPNDLLAISLMLNATRDSGVSILQNALTLLQSVSFTTINSSVFEAVQRSVFDSRVAHWLIVLQRNRGCFSFRGCAQFICFSHRQVCRVVADFG